MTFLEHSLHHRHKSAGAVSIEESSAFNQCIRELIRRFPILSLLGYGQDDSRSVLRLCCGLATKPNLRRQSSVLWVQIFNFNIIYSVLPF